MTGKQLLFQTHWLLGITAGLVLAVMGTAGALYSFQAEILRAMNPQVLRVTVRAGGTLPLGRLVHEIEGATGKHVAKLQMDMQADHAGRVLLVETTGESHGSSRYFDPYTGRLLGEPRGARFFDLMLKLHRHLAMGETGKAITGASTLVLIFACLSGLYLRWPRNKQSWRAWLWLDWSRKGRGFHWDLHAVAGTWCVLFYLLFAFTGLWWSYEWYRNGLRRVLGEASPAAVTALSDDSRSQLRPVVNYERVWASLHDTAGPGVTLVSFVWPRSGTQPIKVGYRLEDAAHESAIDWLYLDAVSGAVLKHERYVDMRAGGKLISSLYALHVGDYFGMPGRLLMSLTSLAMPLFLITGWLLYLDRRRKRWRVREARGAVTSSEEHAGWLICFASQSGFAEQLAWQTAGQLQSAGHPVAVQPLARLDERRIASTRNALFVISTFGDGEAPDSARGFERKVLITHPDLGALRYAVLATGDRQYQQFCGFAWRVNDWLVRHGAKPLFAPVEVDGGDHQALKRWQVQLGTVTGSEPLQGGAGAFANWRLIGRKLLNAGSRGGPVYLISLAAESAVDWQAGDVLEVLPQLLDEDGERFAHAPAAAPTLREYSIASLPNDGMLQLIVRQARQLNGALGVGSGWLTQHLPMQGRVLARVRRNSSFHAPDDDRAVILIGNGTGLAGLRSVIKARIAAGHRLNWLLFGERNAHCDFLCREELQEWLADGTLNRLDLAFSRDQDHKRYVQDLLQEHAALVREWVGGGAAIYVCGSLVGMASGVDAALRAVLGNALVQELLESGRYRRDVY